MSDISGLKFPDNLLYTPTHEWARVEGDVAVVGITEYATHHLTDIVYLEAPIVGENAVQFKELEPEGAVESVKASTPIYSPFSGEILEINEDIVNSPEKLNADCYSNWIYKMKIGDMAELEKLLKVGPYREHCEKETH